MSYQVLLTTSGLGQRLGDLTKFTNKSLVMVGDRPALSYIIEAYPVETEFVVTLGHFGDHVRQFLALAYPERCFAFVPVDVYDGPGSSLAYSILQAEKFISGPFIFHACDTIVKDEAIPEPESNWLGGAKVSEGSHYTSLDVSNGIVTKLKDKGELVYDFSYIGLAGIYHWQEFFQLLRDVVEKNQQLSSLSDVSALKILLLSYPFQLQQFQRWIDIGNVDGLKKARALLPGTYQVLDKNGESIFIFSDSVIKFFANSEVCANRVQRAKILDGLVPKFLGSSTNFYRYEFTPGKLMADSRQELDFKNLLWWLKNNLWVYQEKENFQLDCRKFYLDKTQQRIDRLFLQTGETDQSELINGKMILSVTDLLRYLPDDFCHGVPVRMHGDLILDNILQTETGFCLLDWREDFAGDLEVGDWYYDLAKLNHNLTFNHQLVNQQAYTFQKTDNGIECDILRKHSLVKFQEILRNFVLSQGLDWQRVEILTALIWINMAPLHADPLNKFLFYFGKYHLSRSLTYE